MAYKFVEPNQYLKPTHCNKWLKSMPWGLLTPQLVLAMSQYLIEEAELVNPPPPPPPPPPPFRVVGLLWYGLYRLDIGINLVSQITMAES